MADHVSVSVDIVRGEMQPWTDASGNRSFTSGVSIARLLQDTLPGSARVLMVGPHSASLVGEVAARSKDVTVLLRSVSDAGEMAESVPENVFVLTGGLDGLVDRGDTFDAVVAADGLDRVLGADSDDLDWPQRLDLLTRVVSGSGVTVVACENVASLANLLDRRPADQRHGDDEWRPLYDDPHRPAAVGQFAAALDARGLTPGRIYAAYGPLSEPRALVDTTAATATITTTAVARLTIGATIVAAAGSPLAGPVEPAADVLIRAGLLGATAANWIAVCGASGGDFYAELPGSAATLRGDRADGTPASWRLSVSGGRSAEPAGLVVVEPATVPAAVPDAESVEHALVRLAAAEDVPAFRAAAARLGGYLREHAAAEPTRVTFFDDLYADGESYALGLAGMVTTEPASPDALAAAAWHRFGDRLIAGHRRHPWPPWTVGDELVRIWLDMSGADSSDATLARGREIADAIAPFDATADVAGNEVDLQTALADAAAARQQAFELAGQVFGLERTIGYRDRQLKSREKAIRQLRSDLVRIHGSKAYKLVEAYRMAKKLRRARKLLGEVKRRVLRR